MKPLFFAERTITARGGLLANGARSESSSSSTPLERTLAEVPGLSRLSQTTESESRSIFQAGSLMRASPSSCRRAAGRRIHVEIADEGPVIRKSDVGHSEVGHFNSLADQDEVQLDARNLRGKRRQTRQVRTPQAGRTHEEVDLMRTPESVEVTGHDHWFRGLHDEVVQGAQLILSMPEFQGQMHQKYADIIQLQLNDQPL